MRRGRRSSPAPYPAAAFVDTSGLYALLDRTDANHRQAAPLFRALSAARTRLVLTNFIRAEAHALILNRLGHALADRFLADLRGIPPDNLIRVSEADELAALELIERYQDKDFSLTDATSFVVMERLRIRHAFSFDDDFRQYGWTILTVV
jgi:predicted nucleic acid-binding protein